MIVIDLYVSFASIWHARLYDQSHTKRTCVQASDTECSVMVVVVLRFKAQMIQTPVVDVT